MTRIKVPGWEDGIPARLRILRHEQHRAQEDVARAAGLSVAHYGRLERGDHAPTIATLQRLADALGVDFATLAAKSDKTGQDSHSYPDDHDNFPRAS
jgi:transcriptional regulator with XRE-family HTH domain